MLSQINQVTKATFDSLIIFRTSENNTQNCRTRIVINPSFIFYPICYVVVPLCSGARVERVDIDTYMSCRKSVDRVPTRIRIGIELHSDKGSGPFDCLGVDWKPHGTTFCDIGSGTIRNKEECEPISIIIASL
ncbi:hypothetical protein CsSME_00048044 [Camellia sinensis var. sinensis]